MYLFTQKACTAPQKMSHGFSHVFLTAVWSKLTPNSMTIPCHLSRFYLFPILKHHMDFGQVQVMEFSWHLLRKWWNFFRIWSHFRPNCRQKDMRTSLSHFLQGHLKKMVKKWISNTSIMNFNWCWMLNIEISGSVEE